MAHYSVFSLKDFSNESSPVSIYNGAITPASLAGFLTEFGQMRTAIDNITIGTMQKEKWVGDDTLLSNALPASAFAQRELKWLVSYRNAVSNKNYTVEIPTADPINRLIAGTDRMDLTEAAAAAFVTRFNSFARSPENDTDAVAVNAIFLVGRNI